MIASDPSLGILVEDPMYLWSPAGNLKRTEELSPRSDSKLASGSRWSHIAVEFRFRNKPGDIPALRAEGERAILLAGYTNNLHFQSGVQVLCFVDTLVDGNGIYVYLATLG